MKNNFNGSVYGRDGHIFVIAEISANHGQSFSRAVSLIKEAKESGADAVKFQCYTPDTITIDSNKKHFRIKHDKWGGQTLYQLYEKAYTPWNWFHKLKRTADDLGLLFFATAFDKTSVDFLEELDVPFHKIASFELVDLPLIEYASNIGKPIIMSTGMATAQEIREAVDTARRSGAKDITLLKCVSNHPASPEDMNLKTMLDMKERFGCRIGLSDHTLGMAVSLAAASLGAGVIEKHFISSRKLKTLDSFFSIEPDEMKELIGNIRVIEKSLGKVRYGPTDGEKKNLAFKRSLFAVRDIKKGEFFNDDNIRSIRPADGLKPKYLTEIIGKRAKVDIARGTPLKMNLVKRG